MGLESTGIGQESAGITTFLQNGTGTHRNDCIPAGMGYLKIKSSTPVQPK
jgi:hypothetical protein